MHSRRSIVTGTSLQKRIWKKNYTSFPGDRDVKGLFSTMERSREPRGRSTSMSIDMHTYKKSGKQE